MLNSNRNKWAVLWKDFDGSHKKTFDSIPPTPAVAFGKELRRRGLNVDIISVRLAFAPPQNKRPPDGPGFLWCPYCIKFREFFEAAIKGEDGLLGPVLLRCPICTISIKDAYVRKYNPQFYRRWETEQDQRKKRRDTSKPTAVFRKPRRRN